MAGGRPRSGMRVLGASRPGDPSEVHVMATMTVEEILERVKELKQESAEKDEVIRAQQMQIDELERKAKTTEDQCAELRQEVDGLKGAEEKAEAILGKLSDMLG
jgi:septal ring factor EnvC (AmiA/AmiB activator)